MIITRTPLRISFAGGGSDLPSYYNHSPGSVVSTAINKYVYITINKKFDDLIRLSYSKTETVSKIDDIEHNIAREALRMVGIDKGIEIIFLADIPSEGTGLGSSSSFAVGLLHALYAYKGELLSQERLAQGACELEIKRLGHPIGKQDQYAAAYGGVNFIEFHANESVSVNPLSLPLDTKCALENKLLLFFTGIRRKSSLVLAEQNQRSLDNKTFLDDIVQFSMQMRQQFIHNKLENFGDLLHQGWLLKKKLATNVSNEFIDFYYQKAIDAGAKGGKILGAGGGGFLLFYVEEDRQKAVREALHDLKEIPFSFEPHGSTIIYAHE